MKKVVRKGLRLALRCLIVLVVLAVLAGVALYWLTGETGSRRLVGALEGRLPGSLATGPVAGSLRSGLHLEDIHYQNDGMTLDVDDMTVQLHPLQLFRGWLEIERLALRGVRIGLPPASPSTNNEPLPDVDLPLGIRFHSGTITDLTWSRGDGPKQQIASMTWSGYTEGSTLNLASFAVDAPEFEPAFDIEIQGSLEMNGDYPLDFTTIWTVTPPDMASLDGHGRLHGDLEALRVDQELVAPTTLAVTGTILQAATDPALDLTLITEALQPNALRVDWPEYTIVGQVAASGHLHDLRLRGKLDATGSTGAPWHAGFEINRENDASWQIEAFELARADAIESLTVAGLIGLDPDSQGLELTTHWRGVHFQAGSVPWSVDQGQATISGPIDGYKLQVTSALTLGSDPPGSITLVGHGNQSSFQIDQFEGGLMEGTLGATGRVQWQPLLAIDLDARGQSINPSSFWPDAPGQLDLQAQLSLAHNQAKQLEGVVRSVSIHGTLRGQPVDATAGLTFDESGAITIDRLVGQWAGAEAEARGTVGDTWDLAWSLAVPDLADLATNLAGALRTKGHVTGPRTRPTIAGAAQGSELVYGDHRAESMVGTIDVALFEGGQTDLDWTLNSVVTGGRALGQVVLTTSGTTDKHIINAKVVGDDLNAMIQAQGEVVWSSHAWQGSVTTFDIETPQPKDVADARLGLHQGSLHQGSLHIGSLHIGSWHLEKPAALAVGTTGVTITDLCVAGNHGRACVPYISLMSGGPVIVQTDIDLEALGYLRAQLRWPATHADRQSPIAGTVALAWHDLSTFAPLLPDAIEQLAGKLEVDLDFAGTLEAPTVHGQAVLRDGGLVLSKLGVTFEGASLLAEGTGDSLLMLSGSATSGGGTMIASGTLGLASKALSLHLRGTAVEVLSQPAWTVAGTPDLNLDASPTRIDARGSLALDTVRMVVTSENGKREDAYLVRPGKTEFVLHLEQPFGDPTAATLGGRIDVEIDDLTFLPAFVPTLRDTQGRLDAELALAGTLSAPRVTGDARIRDGQAHLPELGLTFADITFEAHESGLGGTTVQGTLQSGEGTLGITGKFDARARTAEFDFQGTDVTIIDQLEATVVASPALTLRLVDDRASLSGSVTIPSARIDLDHQGAAISASRDVVVIGRTDDANRGPTLDTDVELVVGEHVVVEGLGLKLTPRGSLRLRQEAGRASSAVGELRVDGGSYRIYGQTLTIDSGRVSYSGGPITNPLLDIRATRKTRSEVIAGVQLTGPLAEPEAEVFTEPSSPPSDALAYLVIGRPLAEADDGDDNSLTNAATSVGLKRGNLLLKPLASEVGLDSASFEDTNDADKARLLMGKNLSQRLYVAYGIGLFRPVNTFVARYRLFKNFTLQAQTGTETEIDFLFDLERGGPKGQQP